MFRHRSATTALAVILFATPVTAQNAASAASPVDPAAVVVAPTSVATIAASAPVSSAPTVTNASVGIQRLSASRDARLADPAPQGSVGRNPAMMIVGGVALIAGAVVGGDSGTIIMIGGGLLGLYGLWQYLK